MISNKSIFVSDRTTNLQFRKIKMNFSGYWLQYGTTPNVTNLFAAKSQAIFAFIFLLQT